MQRWFVLWIALLPMPAMAVNTSHWTQNKESDFKPGKFSNVVATNLGDVKLSRQIESLMEEDPDVSSVIALAQDKQGAVYAGTSPKGIVLKLADGKVSKVCTIEGAVSINALLFDADGGLLIATSGESGKVYRIDKSGDKPRQIFSHDGVQYVWALAQGADGAVYAATGPNGQLFSIPKSGDAVEVYKSDESNLTAMISDGHDQLYLGTDPDGLVIRYNMKSKEAFVVYNAPEEEITALAMGADGSVFAATGQMAGDQPQAPDQTKEKAGRPEATPGTQAPLPSKPPAAPKPPAPPNPNPGEPAPIPKKASHPLPAPRVNAPLLLDAAGPGPGNEPTPPQTDNAAPDTSGDKTPPDKNPADNGGDENKPAGNAVYRIDVDGFVQEVFRDNVMIYTMLSADGVLLVGTGAEGSIYQIDPRAEETEILAKTDAKQVTALLQDRDGRVILGLSNTGSMASMAKGYADSGTFISSVLDAHQVSRFGRIQLHGSLPEKTSLKIATRSGNLKDSDARGWSEWSEDAAAAQFVKIEAPSARFLQYRITFATQDRTITPVIRDVDVMYQMPNLAPQVKTIKIEAAPVNEAQGHGGSPHDGPPKPGDEPKPVGTGTQTITWEATDPNGDSVVYSLYFRSESASEWILLKDKLTDPTYTWDTKTVSDGRYEVKVVASDASANPVGQGKTGSRISEALVVDNTPPAIGDLVTNANATGDVEISLRVTDQTSIVASMEYAVDSSDTWQSVLPVDNIFDSPDEKVATVIHGLSAGQHQIALRATDDKGNVGLQTVTVTVPQKKQ